MGTETQDCAPRGMGTTVKVRARLCELSKCNRSSHRGTAEEPVTVSASAGPAIHLYRSGDCAAPCICSITAACGRPAQLEILLPPWAVERHGSAHRRSAKPEAGRHRSPQQRVEDRESQVRQVSSGPHSSVDAESSC